MFGFMETGNIVEYIDRQKITCAVVLEAKDQRLRLLTETNREVKFSANRLSHQCKSGLDLSMGRDKLVNILKETADKRNALINHINIKELWEILNTEQEWIDLATMTEFCFPNNPTGDHESAVLRAFFGNRTYFKFNADGFFPYTKEQVEIIAKRAKEAAQRDRIIESGGAWLNRIVNENANTIDPNLSETVSEYIKILKSCVFFQKESPHYALGQAMLARAGIDSANTVFQALVKAGVIDQNENVDLYRYEIPTTFSDEVWQHATELTHSNRGILTGNKRKDLTGLPLITIDGQATLDFDDALSIEDQGDHYLLGVHIADVGHFIQKDSIIDRNALSRASSIYMPDQKIPMLPPCLAEDLCSLKSGEVRPVISIMAKLLPSAKVIDYEIFPSLIRVKSQLTYYDVNLVAKDKKEFAILFDIAKKFRQRRLAERAIQITLPDINVWIDNTGEITVNHINRESPGRMLVAEIMILANWLMANFLAKHNVATIYRSQAGPRKRLYKNDEQGTLFQNYMQRKLLSRFVLGHKPEHHTGLGLNAYTTATSPIRKYFDLVTQRQIRAILGLESFYTPEEIEHIIQLLKQPMNNIAKIQHNRQRYWILKYLETRIGQKEEAIVLYKKRNNYLVLLPEYMLECDLPPSAGTKLNPEDLVQVTIQHVNARKDVLYVFMG